SSAREGEAFSGALAAYQRAANLAKKATTREVEESRFEEEAERALWKALERVDAEVRSLVTAREYERAIASLVTLRPLVDAFFDAVMVMAEDPHVRQNRLGLLARLVEAFELVADWGKLSEAS